MGAELAHAGVTLEILQAVLREGPRARPDHDRLQGLFFLFAAGLSELRISANGGDTGAGRRRDEIMAFVDAEARNGGVASPLAGPLARALAETGLTPPASLQAVFEATLESRARTDRRESAPTDGSESLAALARSLDHDPFAIHTELSMALAAFPANNRAMFIAALFASAQPAVRAAALGFLLDPEPATASAALAGVLKAGAKGADDATVARLACIRPWLAKGRRAQIEGAIAALGREPIPPPTPAKGETRQCIATVCDGAGAQSLGVTVKRGRRWALAMVLVKQEGGVADAWVADDLSKAEATRLSREITQAAGGVTVSMDYVLRRIAHALTGNIPSPPPPFGLVNVFEVIGAGPLEPDAGAVEDRLAVLIGPAPPRGADSKRMAAAHAFSRDWRDPSWFEAGDDVETLLAPLTSRKQRRAALLDVLLQTRRRLWADRLAWTAAALREAAPGDRTWTDMALIARDLLGDDPLDTMPLMREIAEVSVEVFTRSRTAPRTRRR